MRNVHVAGLDLPDAIATPSGMPEVEEWKNERANAQLLWHIVREYLRVEEKPAEACERNGVAGWLWRGDPARLAKRAWQGLDGSDLANESLAVLYSSLNLSGHMGRLDTGNKFRQWWIADKWDKLGTYPRVLAPSPDPDAMTELAEPAGQQEVRPAPEHDYADCLRGLLRKWDETQAENRRLHIAASLGEDRDELVAEIDRLRERVAELTESSAELRRRQAALDKIIRRPVD